MRYSILRRFAAKSTRHTRVDADLRHLLEHSVFAVAVADADGRVMNANPAVERILGRPHDSIVGRTIGDLLPPGRSRDRVIEAVHRVLSGETSSARIEVLHADPSASGRWVVWTLTSAPSTPQQILAIGEDVTDYRNANDELRQLALHDPLTGLPNRAGLLDRLSVEEIDEAHPLSEMRALAYCDLNEFKKINDTFGHSFGDTVLRTVAVRFARIIGPGDHLARIGGDEFVVAAATGDAEQLIADLHLELRSPLLTPTGESLRVTATIGATPLAPNDIRTVDDMIHDADVDMYRRRGIDVTMQNRYQRRRLEFGGTVTQAAQPGTSELTTEALQQIMDSAPDLIFVKDVDGRYLFLNRAAARVKGRPVTEVIGRDDFAFFPAEFAEILQRNDRSIMEGGHPVEFVEKPLVGGELLTFVSNKAPYFDEFGKVAGIIGISRDVTAAHLTESALRRTQTRWQVAIDCSGVAVWDWDVQTGEVFYSPRFAELLGHADDEIGPGIEEWFGRIHPDDADRCVAQIGDHIRGADPDFAFEHRLRTKRREWLALRCRGRVIERDADESPLRVVATLTGCERSSSAL